MLPQIYAEGVQWEHIDRPSFTESTPVGHGEAGTVPRRGRWAALVSLSAVFPHRPRRSGTKLRMLDDMVCLPHPYPTPLPTPHSPLPSRTSLGEEKGRWAGITGPWVQIRDRAGLRRFVP